jgi:hypothetical protein
MKPYSDVEFAAFVGIDWADAKHDMCLQADDSEEREWVVVPHRPAAIDAWANALRQRLGGQPVAVCLELAKGPLVYALQKQLRGTLQAIERFDAEIATASETLPDYALFRALPGAGASLAPRLLAAFGEQRERYQSAAEVQRYIGIAPVTESSGKKH